MPIKPGDNIPQDALVGQPIPSDATIGDQPPPAQQSWRDALINKFDPEPNPNNDFVQGARNLARGVVQGTAKAVMHPIDTALAAAPQSFGNPYPTTSYTGTSADATNAQLATQRSQQASEQGAALKQSFQENPMHTTGKIAGPILATWGASKAVPEAMPSTETLTAPIRAAQKVGNAVIRNAPAIGSTIGGISSAVAGAERGGLGAAAGAGMAGGYYGYRLGNIIQKIPPMSETFGLPEPKFAPPVSAGYDLPPKGPAPLPPRLSTQAEYADRVSALDQARADAKAKYMQNNPATSPSPEPASSAPSMFSDNPSAAPKAEVQARALATRIEPRQPIMDSEVNPAVAAKEDYESHGRGAALFESRQNRVSSNKGSLFSPSEILDSLPLPTADMEANKMLGYEGRRSVGEATDARTKAIQSGAGMDSPWSGAFAKKAAPKVVAPNVTEQLQQSLKATPKPKKAPKNARP